MRMAKKVMVVDDEKDLVELVAAVLENGGLEVIPVTSGKQCLEKLKKVKPDMILMDVMMPSMTGIETAKRIKSNPKTKNIKLAFLTVARMSSVGKKELKELGSLDYITKPFDNEDLVRRVKKIVG
jgi:two-component system response regulator VicR